MLADHPLRALVVEPVVVVRDARPRGDDHVADPRAARRRDRAEQPGLDRLARARAPRTRRLRRPPAREHALRARPARRRGAASAARRRCGARRRRARRRPASSTCRWRGTSTMPWSAVTTAPVPRRERVGERAGRGIHPLERRHPLVGLPAALVADRVEVGRVDVDERSRMPRREVGGDAGRARRRRPTRRTRRPRMVASREARCRRTRALDTTKHGRPPRRAAP